MIQKSGESSTIHSGKPAAEHKRMIKSIVSLIGLLLVNVLLAGGVYFSQWNLFQLALMYWAESVILGFYTVLKMLYVDTINVKQDLEVYLAVPVFCGIYGLLCILAGLGIVSIFKQGPVVSESEFVSPFLYFEHLLRISFVDFKWICLSIFLGYGVSFAGSYIRGGKFYYANLSKLIILPVLRGITLIAMIFGFIVIGVGNRPVIALTLVMGLKIMIDVLFDFLERRHVAV